MSDQPVGRQARQVILASSSPRRRDFLTKLGIAHSAQAADVDETPLPDEKPSAVAVRLAASKVATVVAGLDPGVDAVVIGADTVVALGDLLLGKPADGGEARAMLEQLRDGPHQVVSAICVTDCLRGETHTLVNSTTVWMRDYSDAEIAAYVATGDPFDKAGAYAIQHPEFAPARALDGCLTSVVGLPLGDLHDLLARVGVPTRDVVSVCEAKTHFACCRRNRD
jgi:septum formation protein